MSKQIIHTTAAPAPIGPYSQAVKANGLLYLSGQIALDPRTGHVEAKTIEEEALQVMKNLEAVLKEAGLGFSAVVKTTIFLTDMSLFTQVNDVYASFFVDAFPARETIAVKGLPRGVQVEISMVALA